MPASTDYLKKLITTMGFTPQDGKSNVYYKKYPEHNGYTIVLDFNKQKIEYAFSDVPEGERIRLGDATTSNFDNSENFVVLECVDRILTKGYKPGNIELEKKYPLGRNLKGKLDILVYNGDAPFLMIECKTWGSEFDKETAKMLRDGGQLLSYYAQDRKANYLCLYSSHIDKKNIAYRNNIILVKDTWRELSSAKDIYDYWNKNFKDNGIFEEHSLPYDIKHKALTCGMLRALREEDSGKIYNQIMEILRHNAISDKPNAFNKLLNLFVCKIIDENQNQDDELGFQWLETDDNENLQMRLNDLYKEGMWRFLEIRIIDHSENDVNNVLKELGIDDTAHKRRLLDMFRDTRLKKSPNFAFVEVQDEKTFLLNAKIVREIVELLQVYKFRYDQKHEFLGNFFELLLNTSMKQEAGQFFTPVPITRFIISSLPLKEFVQGKINAREREILPTVIDYACGSGHFLTEYMEQMQGIIDNSIDVSRAAPDIRRLVNSWQGDIKFAWAKDSVYGIDLDNRLVKTTKVSAFFNGDGEANVIWANGLDNFSESEEYRGLLKQTNPYSTKDNEQFDILISNPPYSVEAFKGTLKRGEDTFELYSSITDNSSEIECLFIERMKQLLKVGGLAGVILPSSILSNGGIYSRAREILFKYFTVKAIVELGSGTFMKTGTNTVILFLERRPDSDHAIIKRAINNFFSDRKDVTVSGIENAFSKFVANVYDNITFDEYLSFVSGLPSEEFKKHELYLDYFKAFGDDVISKASAIEKEKMLYFLLTYSRNIVLAKSGQKQEEKQFLGYEFSERRGHEGMRWLPGGTKLYAEDGDLLNPQKVNSYIYNAYLGQESTVDESVSKHVSYGRMSEFFEYGTLRFDKRINLGRRIKIASKYPSIRLSDCVEVGGGLWTGSKPPFRTVGVIRNTDFTLDGKLVLENIAQIEVEERALQSRKLLHGDIILEKSGGSDTQAVGRVVLFDIEDGDYSYSNFTARLRVVNKDIFPSYLYQVLNNFYLSGGTFPLQISGKSQLKNLDINGYLSTKIPIPPLEIQKQIVADIENIETQSSEALKIIVQLQSGFSKSEYFAFTGSRIGDLTVMVKRGKSTEYGKSDIQIIKSGQARGYHEFDFSQRHYVSNDFVSDERNLRKGDVLINSTGVGTAGRVTLFNLDGKFVVDSHITIVRFDKTKVVPKYAMYALSNIGFKTIEAMANGQSGQIELSLETINGITIPVPPFAKQQEIVGEIETLEAEIAQLQKSLSDLKVEKSKILSKYL